MAENALASFYPVNEPESKKSFVRKAFEKLTLAGEGQAKLKAHAVATVLTVRQYSESAMVGGILGAIHVSDPQGHGMGNGLDIVVKDAQGLGGKDGATKGKDGALLPPQAAKTVPLDGAIAFLGGIAGLATAGMGEHGISEDARNMGASALSVFAFRKGADLMAAKRRKDGKAEGGRVPSLVSLTRESLKAHGEGTGSPQASFGQDAIARRAAELMGRG